MDSKQSDIGQESLSINFGKMRKKVKQSLIIFGLILLAGMPVSCGLDNYDAPESLLQGKIVYKGRPVGLRSTSGAVQLQLYQEGFAKKDPIPVFVNQDGEFSAKLFSGDYKLVTRDKNGPWVNSRDTLEINVDGPTECLLEVTPYFLFSKYNISKEGTSIKASATIEKIVNEATVEKVILAVGKTMFVDESTNLKQMSLTPKSDMTVEGSINPASIEGYNESMHLFARLGVRATGADQYVFTPVIKLQ